jgi:hypothetical protein
VIVAVAVGFVALVVVLLGEVFLMGYILEDGFYLCVFSEYAM